MSDPTVSVIIPTYNRLPLLSRAIDSIVAQTFGDWEIVLVDDGSTDSTRELADRYSRRLGDRLVYIHQPNRGAGAARNRGIDQCRGRFVAFLDSDDEFLPTKLERQLELFELRPELGFVYSDYGFVDLDGTRYESDFDIEHPLAREVPVEPVAPGLYACRGSLFDVLIRGYFICTIVGLVRREVLGSSIRFREEQTFGEEWLFYLEVARTCPAGFVDKPLAVYHYNRGSLARTDKKRNALRYHALLRTIDQTFDDLTFDQRAAVRGNLAQLCRQLGQSARRAGCHREAMTRFAEACRYRLSVGALREVLDAAGRWSLGALSRRGIPGGRSQGTSKVVR